MNPLVFLRIFIESTSIEKLNILGLYFVYMSSQDKIILKFPYYLSLNIFYTGIFTDAFSYIGHFKFSNFFILFLPTMRLFSSNTKEHPTPELLSIYFLLNSIRKATYYCETLLLNQTPNLQLPFGQILIHYWSFVE